MPRTAPPEAKLREIIEQIPTPFHLYDAGGIRGNVRALQEAFSWNPGFTEYFAVKATPNPSILRLLKELGCGVDCASYTELLLANEVGFRGDEIMFSSNATPADEFRLARELGAMEQTDEKAALEKIHTILRAAAAIYNKTVEAA